MGMLVADTIEGVRAFVTDARRGGSTVGFVPTMGALHEGHWSLIERAGADCDVVVVSIFVNPLQFGAGEDFATYPRRTEGDLEGCRERDVGAVFLPSADEMYGGGATTSIRVAGLTEGLCGVYRPGHFDGVCTVVCKLFAIVQADRAYFGEKDYQQLVVIRRMVRDLSIPVEVIGCPIVREPDGLAMSSRNANLSAEDRKRATVIRAALAEIASSIGGGNRDVGALVESAKRRILDGGAEAIDYVSVVDAETLGEVLEPVAAMRVCAAARFGGVRLIDNVALDGRGGGG